MSTPKGLKQGGIVQGGGFRGVSPPQVANIFNISTSMWCKMVQSGKEKVFCKKLLNQHVGISC